jgi:hypothetical protein
MITLSINLRSCVKVSQMFVLAIEFEEHFKLILIFDLTIIVLLLIQMRINYRIGLDEIYHHLELLQIHLILLVHLPYFEVVTLSIQ